MRSTFSFLGLMGSGNVENAEMLYENEVFSIGEFKKYKYLSFAPLVSSLLIIAAIIVYFKFFV